MKYYRRPGNRDQDPKKGHCRRRDNSPLIKLARRREEHSRLVNLRMVRNLLLYPSVAQAIINNIA